ncbi:MAG: response regulator [Acetatifactor sp.]|nr:response regulator [Acetatifactor sp.]
MGGGGVFYLFLTVQIIVICLIFAVLGLLTGGEGSKEQKLMIFFMGGSLIQNAAYLFELTSRTMEEAVIATKMEYLGSTFIAVLYCKFMFNYCYEKEPEILLRIISYINIFVLISVLTCDHHTFFYKRIEWVTEGGAHPHLELSYGPGFVLFWVFSCVVPYMLSVYALTRALINKANKMLIRRYKTFFILSLLPMVSLWIYTSKYIVEYDFTPLALGIMLSAVVLLIWSRRNYDFGRMAAEVVLRAMDDGVIMVDDKRQIVSYNPAAAEVFTELSFQTMGDSIEDMEDFPEDILNEESKSEFSLNNHYYESHVRRILSRKGRLQGYVILVLDVTETRNYMEEIKRVSEQAERANTAKSEFLANMSHEIRTPMNAIIGLSDIIMEESRGRRVYNYASDIQSASKNLLTLINDILDLSKVEAGRMELVPVNYYLKTTVDDVVNMMEIAASQRKLSLQCEYDMSLPCQLHGDDGRIKQILINIMNNAVKFTKQGFVKVSVSGLPTEKKSTVNLVLKIQDSGVGIKPENLQKIFEDFKQVDSKRNRGVEGTGLGLAITRRLVEMMKGTIGVESVYGEGTTFTVTIPQRIVDTRTLAEMPEQPGKKVTEQVETFVVSNYSVLVVDDNVINRKVALGFLKNYEFEMTEAGSGREAIDLVKKNKYNLIFMDHMMPEMDGVEAVQIIRSECGANGRAPVIIALTANAMGGVREMFLKNGFQDFIAKPLDRKQLNDVLSKWIPSAYKKMRRPEDREAVLKPRIEYEDIVIEGIDIGEAVKHHSGGTEDFLELLNLYCLDGKRKVGLLQELLQKADYANYGIEVHGLKSASANIGAMQLSAQAREHEQAVNRGDIDFVRKHFGELLSCYGAQVSEINKYLDARNAVTRVEDQDMGAGIDQKALLREIRGALDSVENFRSKECARRVEELLKYDLDQGVEARLKEVQEQLKMYEDDVVERLLRELLDWLEASGEDM